MAFGGIYNFRVDRGEIPELVRRLREEHMLSQGWGGGSVDLRIDQDDFVPKCVAEYKLRTTRIGTNLMHIRSFKNGDLLVTPHVPKNGLVSMHVVDGDYPHCYAYLPKDVHHLNHRIRVKTSYGLQGNVSIRNESLVEWAAKLQWRRLPILPIKDSREEFDRVIGRLEEDPLMQLNSSPLDEFLDQELTRTILDLKKSLRRITPSGGAISFESVCEYVLTANGYTVVERHAYDRRGGDVDLRCVRQRSDPSPFETGEAMLLVQVKKDEGSTDQQAVSQIIQMMTKWPDADGGGM